jgi:hypothetical protein
MKEIMITEARAAVMAQAIMLVRDKLIAGLAIGRNSSASTAEDYKIAFEAAVKVVATEIHTDGVVLASKIIAREIRRHG